MNVIKEPVKEPTLTEKLEKQVEELNTINIQKDTVIKKLKVKQSKRPSLGFFRSRFKGG